MIRALEDVEDLEDVEKMESLLQKLGKEKTKNENQQENLETNSESENPQSGNRASDEGVRGPQSSPTAVAHPCPSCGATIAWWDRYGGGPHCHRCRDWPTTAVVRAIAVAVDGRWMTFAQANASLAASQGRGEESIDLDGQEASCGHRRRRNVACYPVVARDGAVVVDRDRLAEAEKFVECLDCGKWISRIGKNEN